MKILHVIPSLAAETGGPAKSVPALCRVLAVRGHEVRLFTSDFGYRGVSSVVSPSAEFETVVHPHARAAWFGNLPNSPVLRRALAASAEWADIVHVHSLWNPVATFVMRDLRKAGRHYAVSPRGMLDPVVVKRHRWRKRAWSWLWERANVEEASLVHFTAAAEQDKAVLTGWSLPRAVVAPNVVDFDAWENSPSGQVFEDHFPAVRGREVILFVGRLSWVKNLEFLVDATARVRSKRLQACLVLVGPDLEGCAPTLHARAKNLGMDDAMVITGMLEGDLLRSAYRRGQVLALISKKENFGLALAEGLASGIPAVVSEGVNVAVEWPTSHAPAIRAKAEPEAVACALLEQLDRSRRIGWPDEEARALARREWGEKPVDALLEAYRTLTKSR
jgi:glycosyltransferase involved in cell wall biosynthesis